MTIHDSLFRFEALISPKRMFKKILIANRGEIAVRIARGCREMGISPVAVYSEADREALHVRVADEAVFVGPPPSTESYLRIDRIVDAARRVNAEAIHPGYGFLSENPAFAAAVEDAGLVLIGPPASAMRLMGSKTSARVAAQRVGAPVVPGTTSPLQSLDEARKIAQQIGYPIMLKAAAGGGGKGLRQVLSPDDLESALSLARSEAESSFRDSSVYIEKYIEHPRHIEIQLLGDRYGNIVYLGERECSLQRRHQKVIEECPSPVMDSELRRQMGETAVSIAKAAGYYNAGTIEFLVDKHRNFYFLEMNTRLQVEHPVTELVTGLDLVHQQIRVASGEQLGFTQHDVRMTGHAIECRVYAENPEQNFLPSPGKITGLSIPGGPGIRNDIGIYAGWDVQVYYDPMLAKLAVWGQTRDVAVERLARAAAEYVVSGVRTNLGFFRAVLANEDFRAGRFDTGFVDRFLKTDWQTRGEHADIRLRDVALIAAALSAKKRAASSKPIAQESTSKWKASFRRG
ncbi:MAG TPA: acetyl-CoA carboxylase biotin carboxylase subunit [Blastocatellia bacterium]|nr:acetyl-CoA carboxylase biotin carboxylase subunit [Blastocatellia bacterium]